MRVTTTENLTVEQRKLLDEHLRLVLEENQKLNLTRITDEAQGQLLHVEDSIAAAEILSEAPEGPCADMGSGAGFPGIPLAIVTGRPFWLVESIAKKAASLERMVAELGLDELITVTAARVEEVSLEKRGDFSAVTARALAPLPALIELASPLLRPEGMLVCYKAKPDADELEYARLTASKTGMAYEGEIHYLLSDGVTNRSLYIFKKVGEPDIELPRRIGMAQKRPVK